VLFDKGGMSRYRVDQRIVLHRGREFHFVSAEPTPCKGPKVAPAPPAMWFLMSAGKRWEAIPEVPGQSVDDLDAKLRTWLNAHVFC
jgi:hypothetical protein